MSYTASASAEGYAYTNNKTLVTATASASAISDISVEDALIQATNIAQEDANITALYDVNLINQAVTESTTVSTENINYNTKQINSAPDLTFYYNCNLNDIVYTKTYLGETSLLSTYNGKIYANSNFTNEIGKWTGTGIVYNIYKTDDGFYERSGTKNLYFPNGTLSLVLNTRVVKDNNNNFVLLPNTYNHTIVSGTGDYLGVTGIVSTITNSYNLDRTVNVYFNKN